MEKLIETIPKNAREEISISLTEYHGHDLYDVRVFTEPYSGTEWLATRKGVCLSVAKLPDLIAALQQAEAEARAAGLLEDPETPATAPTEAPEAPPVVAAEGDLTVLGGG